MTAQEMTPVIFRAYDVVFDKQDRFTECIALFPTIPGDYTNPQLVESYMLVGQHGSADYSKVVNDTRPAGEAEYEHLYDKLVQLGYKLKVVKRETAKHRRLRREEAKAWSEI